MSADTAGAGGADGNNGLLPLREPTFFILLSLAQGQKHGYAILKDVVALSQGAIVLSTSTLYEALARILEQGLIERVDEAATTGAASRPGRPRKAYRITVRGQRVLGAEIARLQNLLAAAQQHLLRLPT